MKFVFPTFSLKFISLYNTIHFAPKYLHSLEMKSHPSLLVIHDCTFKINTPVYTLCVLFNIGIVGSAAKRKSRIFTNKEY